MRLKEQISNIWSTVVLVLFSGWLVRNLEWVQAQLQFCERVIGQELSQTAERAHHLAAVVDDVLDGARDEDDDGEGCDVGPPGLAEEGGQHEADDTANLHTRQRATASEKLSACLMP